MADEVARRSRAATFRPERVCFPRQLAFVQDTARFKVACCSRRSGKTVACAILLLLSASQNPDTVNLYLTLTRVSGKRIVWRTLLDYNRRFALGGEPNRAELSLTFPNGAVVLVGGAKDETEIEKYRGLSKLHLVVIDEAQSFPEHIEQLIDDVVNPALMDTKGSLVLIGTPGRVRSGYFYECLRTAAPEMLGALQVEPANDNDAAEAETEVARAANDNGWSVHHWTVRDNPFIEDVEDELARIRRRKRWTVEHPTYQREYLGRWVTEHDALVYKYDVARNGYEPHELPDLSGKEWRFLLGVDQGYTDADVVYALAWRASEPWIWAIEKHYARKQTASQLCAAVAEVYAPLRGRMGGAIRWDEGGGGKKVAEDARVEYGLPIEPAEKPGKVAGIERVNELLRRGVLRIPTNSQAAADASRVVWDPKAPGVRVGAKYHTDAWDAILYPVRAIPPNAVPEIEDWRAAREAEASKGAEVRNIEEMRARVAERIKRVAADRDPIARRDARRLLR